MHRFYVPSMTCGGGAKSVTRALQGVDPHVRIEIDTPAREVRVESSLEYSVLQAALSQAGYPDKH